jgi:YVTN family beta-propeller protein
MLRHSKSIATVFAAAGFLLAATNLEAFSPAAYVSVCCNAPSTAGVFNASTLAQTRSIVTGSGGDGIALSPDGTKLFVTVDRKRQLQVIALATGALLATVPVPIGVSGSPPLELAINPNGSLVYVFASQNVPSPFMLAVDTTTYAVTASASLPAQGSLGPLLVSPDGTKIYFVVGLVNEYIQVLDAKTLAPLTQIPVNVSPTGFAVTPAGLLLLPDTSNELLVIDPTAGTIINQFPLPPAGGSGPGPVISSADGTTAYISFPGPSILGVTIATGAVAFQTPVPSQPSYFAVSSDGTRLYFLSLSTIGAWSLSELVTASQTVTNTVRQLGPPSGLALTSDGQTLVVLNANRSAIVSLDETSAKVTRVTLAGTGLNSLAIPPGGNNVWASSYQFSLGGDLLVLNPATGQLRFTSGVAGGLSFSPDGLVLYAVLPSRLAVLKVPSLQRLATIPAANLTNFGQAVPSPDGTHVYLSVTFVSGASFLSPGAVIVIDTSTYKPVTEISVPGGLGEIALTPDGSTLLCTSNAGRVVLISTASNKVTGAIHLTPNNGFLSGIAISPDGTAAYVTDAANNLLLAVDLASQTQTASIPVGTSPTTVAVTPDSSTAWIATSVGLQIVDIASQQVSGPVALPGTPSAIVFAP